MKTPADVSRNQGQRAATQKTAIRRSDAASASGPLAQLATAINSSPRMQGLLGLASEINRGGVAAAPSFIQAPTAPIQRQEDESPAQRTTGAHKHAPENEADGEAVAQRVIEAYDRNDFAKTRKVGVEEAMEYLTDKGGDLGPAQQSWRDEVFVKLGGEDQVRLAVMGLSASGTLVDFEDGKANSAAVSILSALEKVPVGPRLVPLPPKLKSEGKGTKKDGPKKSGGGKKRRTFIALDIFDQTSEYGRLGANGVIAPQNVKFSQDTAGFRYQNSFILGGQTIQTVAEHAEAMKTYGGSGTPRIEIVLYKGRIMTLDNRRLKAHQLAGVAIPYVKSTVYIGDDTIKTHPHVDNGAPRNNLTLR